VCCLPSSKTMTRYCNVVGSFGAQLLTSKFTTTENYVSKGTTMFSVWRPPFPKNRDNRSLCWRKSSPPISSFPKSESTREYSQKFTACQNMSAASHLPNHGVTPSMSARGPTSQIANTYRNDLHSYIPKSRLFCAMSRCGIYKSSCKQCMLDRPSPFPPPHQARH
jgi:hypothetical protein